MIYWEVADNCIEQWNFLTKAGIIECSGIVKEEIRVQWRSVKPCFIMEKVEVIVNDKNILSTWGAIQLKDGEMLTWSWDPLPANSYYKIKIHLIPKDCNVS